MPFRAIFCNFHLSSSVSRSSAGYHQLLPSSDLSQKSDDDHFPPSSSSSLSSSSSSLSSASSKKKKRRRSIVPVVVEGNGSSTDNQIFFVDPHILEHSLFQDLLRKSMIMKQYSWKNRSEFQDSLRQGKYYHYRDRDHDNEPIFLNCDAILFEFFIWLVENDDPSLRNLDLNDLMEFYGTGTM